jgi:hypothetical protein
MRVYKLIAYEGTRALFIRLVNNKEHAAKEILNSVYLGRIDTVLYRKKTYLIKEFYNNGFLNRRHPNAKDKQERCVSNDHGAARKDFFSSIY